jgi:hypothetical protein
MRVKELFENEIVPDNVLSFVIGKFFAEYIGIMFEEIGTDFLGYEINIHLDDKNPCFVALITSETAPKQRAKMRSVWALCKKLHLDSTDWLFDQEYRKDTAIYEISLLKQAGFPVNADKLKAGVASVDLGPIAENITFVL